MKQLIISDYVFECDFSYVVIDNLTVIEKGNKSSQLKKYGLYSDEYDWFNDAFIDFDDNEKIQDFDMIIVCDNGSIKVFNHYRDLEKDKGK